MNYFVHVEIMTDGGTSALILMQAESRRILDLLVGAVRKVGNRFDDVEKGDAVREFEAIIYEKEWLDIRKQLKEG